MSGARETLQNFLAPAGVTIDGDRPWDPRVFDPRFHRRVLAGGSLALGESYVDGWWDVPALDEMIARILRARLDEKVHTGWRGLARALAARLGNPQNLRLAVRNVHRHYDIGNDLYRSMLDARLVYSCGYWPDAGSLDEAQDAKLDLVCRKIGVRRGDSVLDIGCGWGSWARYAAERYGARVTGITLSRPQAELGRELCAGLPVDLRVEDYRRLGGRFDHVVSIGMFEHVGVRNYRRYMKVVHDRLSDDGLFLLHTIGGNISSRTTDSWLHKYIFPNSMLPSVRQIADASEGLFVIEDWQNIGADYDRTLMAWWRNLEDHWNRLAGRYDERFRRRWKYYLLASAGSFRARRNQVWQIVFSKHGVPGGYRALRPGQVDRRSVRGSAVLTGAEPHAGPIAGVGGFPRTH